MKKQEYLSWKKAVTRRLKLRIISQKRLWNGDRISKHLANNLNMYINLDKELLRGLNKEWQDLRKSIRIW